MLQIAFSCAAISLVAGLILVPVVRSLAHLVGIVDRPDPTRKLHAGATALGGGVAVFTASVLSILATALFVAPDVIERAFTLEPRWNTLLLCTGLIVLLGLLDDWVTLRGRQKLLGQIVIVAILVGSGTVVNGADFLGWQIDLGVFALPLTMLWLLGAVNALNLLDGADGIASTVGAIICGGLAIIAFHKGNAMAGCVAVALSGSLFAFLRYNRPPASIFLGDSGSMMIGLIVGTLGIWTNAKESTAIAVIIPIAVLSVPLFDSSIAILRRVLTGRSIYAADRAHMHHVLQAFLGTRGYSPSWMLVIVAALTLIPVAGATASVLLDEPMIALVATVFVLGGLVLTKSFGHAELSLLLKRSASFGSSLLSRSSHHADGMVRHTSVRLQGSRDWDMAWTTLVEFAEKNDISRIKLDMNLAWLHEGFHGDWQKARPPEKIEQWSLRLPIAAGGQTVGNLSVTGRGGGPVTYQLLELLIQLISDLQPHFERIVRNEPIGADDSPPLTPASARVKSETIATGETQDAVSATH